MSKTFNFINSVKGGCGKTTFSIFLSTFFAKYSGNLSNDGLLIDVDLQGTSLQHLMYGEENENAENDIKYLHDAVEYPDNFRNFIQTPIIAEDKNKEFIRLNMIFSNPDIKMKKLYRISPQYGYTPAVQHSIYQGGMQELLQNIAKSEEYNHLIFDMPPSSEGFSQIAMDCVLNDNNSKICKMGDKINIFFVTTLDSAQVKVVRDEVYDFLSEINTIHEYQIFIIINNPFGNTFFTTEESNIDEHYKNAYKIFDDFYNKTTNKLVQEMKEKVYFLTMPFQQRYLKKCVNSKGLAILEGDTSQEDSENSTDLSSTDQALPVTPVDGIFVNGAKKKIAIDTWKNLFYEKLN